MSLTVSDLSPDQRQCYDAIIDWARDGGPRPVLSLGGFAGSGKSTLVSLVAEALPPPVAFCALTGKASSVLKRKLAAAGIGTVGAQKPRRDGGPSLEMRPYCGTIHSLIYRPCECREPQSIEIQKPCPSKGCGAETSMLDDGVSRCTSGHFGLLSVRDFETLKPRVMFIRAAKDASGNCTKCGGKEWLKRDVLDRSYSLIIVDEASMVDDAMLADLKSYGAPILAVGDHGQLPPVGGAGSLMRNPNLRLEKIHRQAEGNPIIALSKMIRETGRLPESMPEGAVVFGRMRDVERIIEERYADASPERLLAMGLACYTNRRRVGLNVAVRRARGTARVGRELPRGGEHVVCLRNQKTRGSDPIYNGMRGVLAADVDWKPINSSGAKSEVLLAANVGFPDDGLEPRALDMLAAQFCREKTFATPEELARETGLRTFAMAGSLFDFGYAMTVHKLQGSSIEDLVVLVERPGPVSEEDYRRWLYTAVTRAAEKLTVLR